MAATVDADYAIALLDEEQHLSVPIVAAERPAMMEDNRLAFPPVFVEDLNSILRCNEAHFGLPEAETLAARSKNCISRTIRSTESEW
jgi:hypothetical protein